MVKELKIITDHRRCLSSRSIWPLHVYRNRQKPGTMPSAAASMTTKITSGLSRRTCFTELGHVREVMNTCRHLRKLTHCGLWLKAKREAQDSRSLGLERSIIVAFHCVAIEKGSNITVASCALIVRVFRVLRVLHSVSRSTAIP